MKHKKTEMYPSNHHSCLVATRQHNDIWKKEKNKVDIQLCARGA
jgi:hypothetical protein